MNERIAITGGGTAGHVNPALAVAQELTASRHLCIVWIGSHRGPERRLARRAGLEFRGVPAGKLRRYLSARNLIDVLRVVAGWAASLIILARLRPAVLFSKGGFVTVPVVVAAWMLGIPVLSHESDTTPGLATRIGARFSAHVLVSFPETIDRLPAVSRSLAVVTGNPVRSEVLHANAERGRLLVGCPRERAMVVVTGGSQGARGINRIVEGCLEELRELCFVVHQHGPGVAPVAGGRGANYYGEAYIHEGFADILAAADLVICRAGANNLMELAALGKPAVLIPLPLSSSRGDQIENAKLFADQGAAVCYEQGSLTSRCLLDTVGELLDHPGRLDDMGAQAASLSQVGAARAIADVILEQMELR